MWYNFKAIARLHMHTHPERQKPIWVRVVVWGYYRELEAMGGVQGRGKREEMGEGKGLILRNWLMQLWRLGKSKF